MAAGGDDIDLAVGNWVSKIIFPTVFSNPSFTQPSQDYRNWIFAGLDLEIPGKRLKEIKNTGKGNTLYDGFQVVTQVITEWIQEKARNGEKANANDLINALRENRLEVFGEALQSAFINSLENEKDNEEGSHSHLQRMELQQQQPPTPPLPQLPQPQQQQSSHVAPPPPKSCIGEELHLDLQFKEDDITIIKTETFDRENEWEESTDEEIEEEEEEEKLINFSRSRSTQSLLDILLDSETEASPKKRKSNDVESDKEQPEPDSQSLQIVKEEEEEVPIKKSRIDSNSTEKRRVTLPPVPKTNKKAAASVKCNRFHQAVREYRIDDVLDLLEDGYEVNQRTNDDFLNSALHLAAFDIQNRDDALEMIMTLIENGAEVQAVNSMKATFLDGLFNPAESHVKPINYKQFHKLVQCLIKEGHKEFLVTPLGANREFVIHRAMRKGVLGKDTVNLLHYKGILNRLSEAGNGMLYYAIVGNREKEIMEQLIDYGSNRRHINKEGFNLLHVAAQFDNYNAFTYLINLNPELFLEKTKGGLTAVDICMKSKDQSKWKGFLEEAKQSGF